MNEKEVVLKAVEYRRYIHSHPEISGEEFETQNYIAKVLDHYHISYKTYGTGIIATIGTGENCIALRADMDALRINEETNLHYRSEKQGIMHACGHDMHVAMLLGTAILLKFKETGLGGTVKLVFQPSEEKRPGGARMLLPYLMESPVPQAIFGQHVFPGLPIGTIGIRKGSFFASSDNIIFAIEGKGTHAAMPQLGADPILAAAALIQFYQSIITKFRNPLIPAVLSITSIHGGTANNIIPDRVEILGTVRTHDNELRHRIFEIIHEKSPAICDLYGCRFIPDMQWNGLPPLVNDPVVAEKVKEVASRSSGITEVIEPDLLTLGEDFAIYLEKIPGAFWILGVRSPELEEMPPLHNPKMSPDERAIPIGINILVDICRTFLQNR